MTIMSLQEYGAYAHSHPNRILIMARRLRENDYSRLEVRVCRSRKNLLSQLKKQRSNHWSHWKPCVAIKNEELC